MNSDAEDDRHLPTPALIEAYGNGGFRFGGLSHRGSLLCLPDGVWAWPIQRPEEIDVAALARIFARAEALDFVLLGTGPTLWPLPDHLRQRFRDLHLSVDAMPTSAAVRTYNVLLAERRRVAAGLIAVG